jgi:putative transposase
VQEIGHQRVLEVLNSQRSRDKPPAEVFATPLDEGTYLCSIRTIYRILEQASELGERRDQLLNSVIPTTRNREARVELSA